MRGNHLFTYGSLMFPAVWQSIVKGKYASQVAHINGFYRRYIHGDTYPVIIPAVNKTRVPGVLYSHIASEDWQLLDKFEGALYQRQTVIIHTDSRKLVGQAYVLRPNFRHLASTVEWQSHTFAEQFLTRFHKKYC